MSHFFRYVALILVLQFFSWHVEGASSKARDRVILTYTTASDRCKKITPESHSATKEAADAACDAAFKALDDIKANNCHNWKLPECRLLDGTEHSQCTCKVSSPGLFGRKVVKTKTFWQCALTIWTEELEHGEVVPSQRFQEVWRYTDIALETSRSLSSVFSSKAPSDEKAPYFGAESSRRTLSHSLSTAGTRHKILDPNVYCHDCKRYWSTRGNLIKHIRKKHPESEAANVKRRTKFAAGEYKNPEDSYCRHCQKQLSNRGNLVKHYKDIHTGIAPDPPSKRERGGGPKLYVCEFCGQAYGWESSLTEHRKKHLQNLQCPACKQDFSTKGNLTRHINSNHPELAAGLIEPNDSIKGSKRKRPNDPYCFLCYRYFANTANLERHIETGHPGEKTAALGLVSRSFFHPENMNNSE